MRIANCITEAEKRALAIKFRFNKQVSRDIVQREAEIGQLIGEAGCAERILMFILEQKKDPNFSFDDLEAALQLFISETLNHCSKKYHGVKGFPVERVLKHHGYYDKKDE